MVAHGLLVEHRDERAAVLLDVHPALLFERDQRLPDRNAADVRVRAIVLGNAFSGPEPAFEDQSPDVERGGLAAAQPVGFGAGERGAQQLRPVDHGSNRPSNSSAPLCTAVEQPVAAEHPVLVRRARDVRARAARRARHEADRLEPGLEPGTGEDRRGTVLRRGRARCRTRAPGSRSATAADPAP